MPGVWGAANWGGAAYDPETAILYVKATNWPFVFKVGKPKTGTADADYTGAGFTTVQIEDGIPIHKPPYSTLTAIDLNAGEHVWQIPLGDMPSLREHPLLKDVDLPPSRRRAAATRSVRPSRDRGRARVHQRVEPLPVRLRQSERRARMAN